MTLAEIANLAGSGVPLGTVNLVGTGALISCLIWAVRRLDSRLEISQRELVSLLRDTIQRNTEALHDVRDVLTKCRAVVNGHTGHTDHFRAPAPAHWPDSPPPSPPTPTP